MNIEIKPDDLTLAAKAAANLKRAYGELVVLCNDAERYGSVPDDRAVQLQAILKVIEENQDNMNLIAKPVKGWKPEDQDKVAAREREAREAAAKTQTQPFAPAPDPAHPAQPFQRGFEPSQPVVAQPLANQPAPAHQANPPHPNQPAHAVHTAPAHQPAPAHTAPAQEHSSQPHSPKTSTAHTPPAVKTEKAK